MTKNEIRDLMMQSVRALHPGATSVNEQTVDLIYERTGGIANYWWVLYFSDFANLPNFCLIVCFFILFL